MSIVHYDHDGNVLGESRNPGQELLRQRRNETERRQGGVIMRTLENIASSLLTISTLAALVGCSAAPEPSAQASAAVTADASPAIDPIIVVATAKVKPGTDAAFTARSLDLVTGTRQEPGNLGYLFHQSADDPTEFVFYERWATEGQLDAHMQGPVLGTFFTAVKDDFVDGYPVIKKYHVIEPSAGK
jgi:quinol monooxygenase YgiN